MNKLIILDRDGVLNKMVVDQEHGTVDSPLNPSQVELIKGVPESLLRLQNAGYKLAIATNQPSAAKGKTTRTNLEDVHSRVIELAQSKGAKINSSHICFHRSEDKCNCRKPKPALLIEAITRCGDVDTAQSWMIGDGVTDVEAGIAAGVKTAFLGPKKCDHCKIFSDKGIEVDLWATSLEEFVNLLLDQDKI